jgi:hypothetical protein
MGSGDAVIPAGRVGATLFGSPKAVLQIPDSTVRCILRQHSRWFAKRLGIPDLKNRLNGGEQITAFEFRLNSYHIKWPKTSMGTAFQISQGNSPRWTVSFGARSG